MATSSKVQIYCMLVLLVQNVRYEGAVRGLYVRVTVCRELIVWTGCQMIPENVDLSLKVRELYEDVMLKVLKHFNVRISHLFLSFVL